MNVLSLSAHPDDETLGCGGTLLKHRAAGDQLYWLVATQGYQPQWPADVIERKAVEVSKVAEAYCMKRTYRLGLPAVRLDTLPQADLIDRIREVIAEVKPEIVYLVHEGDVHSDHQALFQATMCVLKAVYMRKFGVRRVLSYETLSSTEAAPPQISRAFIPTVYHDITPHIDEKIRLMSLYESEAQADPFPRGPSAIRALARYRGATIGAEYAEAFVLIREVS